MLSFKGVRRKNSGRVKAKETPRLKNYPNKPPSILSVAVRACIGHAHSQGSPQGNIAPQTKSPDVKSDSR